MFQSPFRIQKSGPRSVDPFYSHDPYINQLTVASTIEGGQVVA